MMAARALRSMGGRRRPWESLVPLPSLSLRSTQNLYIRRYADAVSSSTSTSASSSSSSPSSASSSSANQQSGGSKEFISSATTYYDLFPKTFPNGPPPKGSFAVDPKSLRSEFLKLQASTHPDLVRAQQLQHHHHHHHHHHDHQEATHAKLKRSAEAASARLNRAHATLQDPLQRAQYLLSLRGFDLANDETAKVEEQELLMEVLEAREEIEAAEEEEDLVDMTERNSRRVQESVKILSECFENDDLEGAKKEAVRLRYWINIKESLDSWEKGKPVVLAH